MSNVATVLIHSIPRSDLEAVRTSGRDVSGNPVEAMAAPANSPLRCCLRNAREGERAILFGYGPMLPGQASPYREIGAVFAHAEDCGAPEVWDSYPSDWHGRPQVLRAYDDRGWIHPASTTHDGSDPARAIAEVLAVPGVVEVHSRNIVYGCFMFSAAIS